MCLVSNIQGQVPLGRCGAPGARIHNDEGPALHAEDLHVDAGLLLHSGFDATGTGTATILLTNAHVGELDCTAAQLRNNSGSALRADHVRIDRALKLGGGFRATGAADDVVVDLMGTRIGSGFTIAPSGIHHHTDPHALLAVDGMTYTGLPHEVDTTTWLRLLRKGTPDYAAQPYQQLAAAHRAAGHDTQARHVLRAQRRDQIERRAITSALERTWARFTGLTLGFGYQPWRALIGLLATAITSVVLAIILGGKGGLAQARSPTPPTPITCPIIGRIGTGLDTGTPLLTTTRARCEPTDTPTGHILTISTWTLRLLAWAFATLFIAGFTSAVRKT